MRLREAIERILNEYTSAKKETFAGHPMGKFFRNDVPGLIYDTGIVNPEGYLVTGSIGQGNWANIPWVSIFDRRITTSATKGIYIVYLLSKDGNSIYLTFNQGCTEIKNQHGKPGTIKILREKASELISKMDSRGFLTDENVNLGGDKSDIAEFYQKGTIFYKEYRKGFVPDEGELQDDLRKMMDIYREYAVSEGLEKNEHNEALEEDLEIEEVNPEGFPAEGGEEELSIKDTINSIKDYIEAKGFTYEDGLIENFYLSLKSKPFVILAGTSGTGKTRLAKLFAEAIGATSANGRYKMVPVRPDWSDSSDLFGHVDLNGNFVPGAIIEFIKAAELDNKFPYFLCLDEMNLARVEYYLSDILSVIETRGFIDGKFADGEIISDPLVQDTYYGGDMEAKKKYGTVTFPENLYIIGTVNMDETTFPFSRKVLDRANTIEFSYVDLIPQAEEVLGLPKPASLTNAFLKTEYLLLAQCEKHQEAVSEYCVELQGINGILKKANSHVGYRVRDEVVFYLLNNKKAELLPKNEAMDNEIMQKILPRIQGSSASVKNMLCDLFKHCAGDYDGYRTESDDISSSMFKVVAEAQCRYKKSAEKIAFMVRRYEEDGFTSYWL